MGRLQLSIISTEKHQRIASVPYKTYNNNIHTVSRLSSMVTLTESRLTDPALNPAVIHKNHRVKISLKLQKKSPTLYAGRPTPRTADWKTLTAFIIHLLRHLSRIHLTTVRSSIFSG